MAQAKKLPSGSWRVRISLGKDENGSRIYKSITAPTKKDAEYEAAKYMANVERVSKNDYTVAEAVENIIQAKKDILSPSTVRGYMKIQRNHLQDIGSMSVSKIRSDDLQKYVNNLAINHKAKTVRNVYNFVLSAIRLYSDRAFRVTLPQRAPYEYNVPTDAQVKALIDSARPELKLAILLASVGTLRRGEICSLKHKDVLRDFSAVYVHSDMVKGPDNLWIHKEMPKNASSVRRVPLLAAVMNMIEPGDPDDYVVGLTPSALGESFIYLRNKLGLKCRFHDLRHYAASILHAIGIPDQYIMERGGWSTDATLKAVYRNTLPDKSSAFSKKANEYFEKNLLKRDG